MRSVRYLTLIRALACGLAATSVACSDDAAAGPPPPAVLTTIDVAVPATIEVGQQATAVATGRDRDGAAIATGPVTWSSHRPDVAAVGATTGAILAISSGQTDITATTSGKSAYRIVTVVAAPAIRINEVQPLGDARDDWIKLFNPTSSAVDVSGWTLADDNRFGPTYDLPSGSIVPPGGRLVIDETGLPFGLEGTDTGHLYSRFGVQVDATAWTLPTPVTRSRCPDGVGAFVDTPTPTKGAVNACR